MMKSISSEMLVVGLGCSLVPPFLASLTLSLICCRRPSMLFSTNFTEMVICNFLLSQALKIFIAGISHKIHHISWHTWQYKLITRLGDITASYPGTNMGIRSFNSSRVNHPQFFHNYPSYIPAHLILLVKKSRSISRRSRIQINAVHS